MHEYLLLMHFSKCVIWLFHGQSGVLGFWVLLSLAVVFFREFQVHSVIQLLADNTMVLFHLYY